MDPHLEDAVAEAARELWPDLRPGELRVLAFRSGVLDVLLDSHARYAEARGFLGEALRERVNAILAERRASSPAAALAGRSRETLSRRRDGDHVTGLRFHVAGTR
ncbi:MAG: hypothetical protein R3F30_01010 [Planctomycetota bacterium]